MRLRSYVGESIRSAKLKEYLRGFRTGEVTCPDVAACNRRRCPQRPDVKPAFWRIMYRIDPGEILILEVFSKKTRTMPTSIIDACKQRLKTWDE